MIYNLSQVGKNLSDKVMTSIINEFKDSFKFSSVTVGEVTAFVKHTLSSGADIDLLFQEITASTGKQIGQMAIFGHTIVDVGKRFAASTLLLLRFLQYCIDNFERPSIICTAAKSYANNQPQLFTMTTLLATPKSTGEVRLGWDGKLEISPGYLTHVDCI
jgi:hypothetical protein